MPNRLQEKEEKWREFFASEQCPPVIGLAPLSDAETEEIAQQISAATPGWSAQARFGAMLRFLDLYPAAMAVWLARKAGEAYRDGNFFGNLAHDISIEIPPVRRVDFADGLTRACKRVMANFVAPPEGVHFVNMEPCLFHAALPLCHCGTFSEAVRWVERRVGLPSLGDPEAGEELRAQVLQFPVLPNVPILKKAIAGPAGAMICETALRVVFEQDYGAISPRLGQALADAFANVRPETLRRSARPPFLRLGADLTSFEIVCPRQDRSVASGSGLIWRIDDEPHRVSIHEEMTFSVPPGTERVKVELRGLTDGRTLQREFVLDCANRDMPCLLFEHASRKERALAAGEKVELRAGEYLLVHAAEAEVTGGELLAQWVEGSNVTSSITLRPGRAAQLSAEKTVLFESAQMPYLDFRGACVRTDDLQQIYFGWPALPPVWCPCEVDGPPEEWVMRVTYGETERTWQLRAGEVECRMRNFDAPESGSFLAELPVGVLRLRLIVSRMGRRPELDEALWYWNGLASWREGERFNLDAFPENVSREHSAGFLLEPKSICHRQDGAREHMLSFFIDDELHSFRWTRAGVFLESIQRRAGMAIQPIPHAIPHTFSASVDSMQYLRIWMVPPDDAELVVNGHVFEQMNRRAARSFVELSLATLSTHHAQGRILLRRHGVEQMLAHFTRPLVPRIIDLQSNVDYVTLLCKFDEAVEWVQPRVLDLITGTVREYEGRQFDTSGHALFPCNHLPTIECTNIAADPLGVPGTHFRVSLNVPRSSWPSGVWMIDLDIRRDERSGWQPLQDAQGGCLCIVHVVSPEAVPSDFRAAALWWAFGHTWHGMHIPEELPRADDAAEGLCGLLDEITALLARGFNEHAWCRLRVLEMLHTRLGREAARLLAKGDEQLAARLLDGAARETNSKRSLLIAIPELFALHAESYRALPPMNRLLESLRWCGDLTAHSRVADAIQPPLEELIEQAVRSRPTGLFRVLQNFRRQPDGCAVDFGEFDLALYWERIVGPITDADREHASSLDFLPEESLGREHVLCALAKWWDRRDRGEGGAGLGEAHSVFVSAPAFAHWFNQRVGRHWFEPWVRVDLDEDALTIEACRFISVFALTCRAAAAGWLSFDEALSWLYDRHPASAIGKAFTTLVALGPELFGYHLMLWELIIRTAQHD